MILGRLHVDTADGAPLLIAIQNEREFANLCSIVLEDPSILKDPRFATNVARVKVSRLKFRLIQMGISRVEQLSFFRD